LSCLFVF